MSMKCLFSHPYKMSLKKSFTWTPERDFFFSRPPEIHFILMSCRVHFTLWFHSLDDMTSIKKTYNSFFFASRQTLRSWNRKRAPNTVFTPSIRRCWRTNVSPTAHHCGSSSLSFFFNTGTRRVHGTLSTQHSGIALLRRLVNYRIDEIELLASV